MIRPLSLVTAVTLFFAATLGSVISNKSLACSNVAVNGNGFSATARTMDFPFNTGGVMGVGFVNQKNTSDLSMTQDRNVKAATWTNKHNFLGQTWLAGPMIVDGINDAGVYAAFLYLPDFTTYPKYNSTASQSVVLGVMDTVNYVLGMADNVPDAIAKLKKFQMVQNAVLTHVKGNAGLFISAPIHLVIRDKKGNAAVIEWIKGKTIIYPNAGNILTNAPPLAWQRKNAQEFDYVKTANINAKFDGAYMNGSGFLGIPGDWTPPSRFARATQIIKHTPKPDNEAEALRLALSVLESTQVPIGTNESPTLWKTVADLKNYVYYFYPMYTLTSAYAVIGQKQAKLLTVDLTHAWKKFDIKKIAARGKIPSGMIAAILQQVPKNQIKKIVNVVKEPTKGT